MAGYAIKYLSQINPNNNKTTHKLDKDGYCYQRRRVVGDTVYWQCDQRAIKCKASVIEDSGGFRCGRNHWIDDGGKHEAHAPDILR